MQTNIKQMKKHQSLQATLPTALASSIKYICFKILRIPSRKHFIRNLKQAADRWNAEVTWAAMTLCLSTMSLHLRHWQSLQLQKRLCPFRGDTKPWFLQREHLGILGGFGPLDGVTVPADALLCFSLVIAAGRERIWFMVLRVSV